ncbi:hypothetical protein BH18VER2_BH18VER2_06040 [soil metagenome]
MSDAQFDLDAGAGKLANISTRGLVEAGDDVMIGRLIVDGDRNSTVAVRGIGPSLGAFGIANPLPDPTLELRDSQGALVASDDD